MQCIAFLAALLGKTGDPASDAALPPAGAVRCAVTACSSGESVCWPFVRLLLASPALTSSRWKSIDLRTLIMMSSSA